MRSIACEHRRRRPWNWRLTNHLEADPAGKPGSRRIRVDLWPSADFVNVGVRGDASELSGVRTEEFGSHAGEKEEVRFVDAVAAVMDRRMETDARIVVLGEDVHRLKGGTNGATKGLVEKYPDRILGTPISENAFAGLGGEWHSTAASVP